MKYLFKHLNFKNLKAIANLGTGDSLKPKSNSKSSWLSQVAGLFLLLTASQLFMSSKAEAVPLSLKRQFLGYYDYVSTGGTLRTGSDASGNFCAVTNSNTAPLSGVPASATIKAAYLYWAGSGNTADTSVTFQGQNVNADQVYTDTFTLGSTTYRWFGGVADVTSIVATNLNSNYTFADLSVSTGSPWCNVRGVLSEGFFQAGV